jgi:hypothetical protein
VVPDVAIQALEWTGCRISNVCGKRIGAGDIASAGAVGLTIEGMPSFGVLK